MNVRRLIVIGMLLMLAGCAKGQRSTDVAHSEVAVQPAAPRPAMISHVVYAKLIDSSQADELILACDTQLATIPGVVSYACGKHLDTGRGERVDADYDVGLYLGFDTQAALEAYGTHPQHLAILNEWQPRLQWIRIHDFVDRSY
jgi:hypothetical protein